ncbi:hypothetical protein [Cohnella caldifontis]|uniref:hypothetical protein n=1 Tax=Cohnella caldifontis TaxID=3027471 RepID=UPI0023EC328A|nr:hypothetical protein [Cohnella sp. YIM B05605]
MNAIRFDHHFNLNEWFIVAALFVGTLMVLWLPRRFPKKTTGVYLMCGMFWGFFFDHTLSVFPVSYYVINDAPRFEVMDFFPTSYMHPTAIFSFIYMTFSTSNRLLRRCTF